MADKAKKWKRDRSFLDAFIDAWRGISEVFKNERSWRAQVLISLIILVLGWELRLSLTQMAITVLTVGLILILEVINTVIEDVSDIVKPQYNESVRRLKDMMAGAVLIACASAIIIGLLLFVPPLLALVY